MNRWCQPIVVEHHERNHDSLQSELFWFQTIWLELSIRDHICRAVLWAAIAHQSLEMQCSLHFLQLRYLQWSMYMVVSRVPHNSTHTNHGSEVSIFLGWLLLEECHCIYFGSEAMMLYSMEALLLQLSPWDCKCHIYVFQWNWSWRYWMQVGLVSNVCL